ncbi:EmrB/QacA family drug resistance transporter [Streptomyces venezuelae]|uniref:MFS transporter n=1 Tax=unclassified Streptomyces TaxID=2593676 RepID=UPI0006BE0237|nr:EmrB/QacA family drug resistance transporter [Streptomyces venezuelae]CUM41482.1 drug resistance transporter, EmrB/QacA subfamily [Streptomyces venezuelae]
MDPRHTTSASQHVHHPHEGPPSPVHRHRWWVLTLLCLAQFMLIADVTVVNVALPTIGAELSLSGSALTWIVTAYTLFFGSLLLLGGRLADTLGKLRMYLVGLSLFTAASLASGLAASGPALITARSVQGVGAALLSPAAMALVTVLFDGPARHKALGLWAAIGGAGAAAGVLLGGVLVSGPGWSWIFYINIPVGLVALVAVPALLGRTHRAATPAPSRKRLDPLGALTLTTAPALLIYGLVESRDRGFDTAHVWLPLAGAAVFTVAFFAVERRVAVPLVRLEVLARRSLLGGALVMLAASGLLISAFFLNSFYVQHILGENALTTGLAFLPVAVAVTLGAHLGGTTVGRIGWRLAAVAGFALTALGALLLTGLTADSGLWTGLTPGFSLMSFGLGTTFVCATTAAMNGLGHQDTGLASGLVTTAHELGAALGVAVIAMVAGASLEGAGDLSGYAAAFTTSAAIAVAAGIAGWFLLPAGRPDLSQGRVMAH